MNASSEDIKDLLIAESSLGLTFATNLFIAKEPTTPNICVTIFDTGGGGGDLQLSKESGYFRTSIQIRVRDTDYRNAMDTAHEIVDFLHNTGNTVINGTRYTVIRCSTYPTILDWDKESRVRIITNFEIQKTDD